MDPELPVAERILADLADPWGIKPKIGSSLWDIEIHRPLLTGFLYPCKLNTCSEVLQLQRAHPEPSLVLGTHCLQVYRVIFVPIHQIGMGNPGRIGKQRSENDHLFNCQFETCERVFVAISEPRSGFNWVGHGGGGCWDSCSPRPVAICISRPK